MATVTEDTWEKSIYIPSQEFIDQAPFTMRVFGDTDVSLHVFHWKVSSQRQAFTFHLFEDREDTDLSCACDIVIGAADEILGAVEVEGVLPLKHRCFTELNSSDYGGYQITTDGHDESDIAVSIHLKFSRDKPAPSSPMSMGQFGSPMLDDMIFSDMSIVCRGQTFDCHKLILAGRSEVFKTMLTGQFREAKENKMEINHFQPDTVHHLIQFLYKDDVDEDAITWELFGAAKMYDLSRLQRLCLSSLRKSLDVSNCCQMLEAATLHDLPEFFDLVVSFLRSFKAEVMQTDDWKRVAANGRLMATIEHWIR